MSWASRIATAAGRGAVRLVPADRRDWAEAVWAEAHEVPTGWPRLAWRAGGLGLIAEEGQMARTIGSWLLFAVAAGAAVWGAWPGSPVSHAAPVQGGIIITLALLVCLPLLTRLVLGSPANRAARRLRAGFYVAILAVMPAQTAIRLFLGADPRSGIDRHVFDVIQGPGVPGTVSGSSGWAGEIAILVFTGCSLVVLLALTARRTPVAPATLAIGAGAGLMLGVAMYAISPLGLNVKFPDRPWLHGSAADTVGTLAWILLFGAPLVAGALAGRRCSVEDDPAKAAVAQIWQGIAAGVVSGGVGAALVTVLGAGTTALMVSSAWVRDLLYHGQHVTASAVYGRELYASQDVPAYFLLLFVFPFIGLIMGLIGTGIANPNPRLPDGGRPGGPPGPGAPEPLPAPPDGGRHVDAEEPTVLAGGADARPTAPTPVLAHH